MSILYSTFARFLRNPTRIAVIDEQRKWKAFELLIGSLQIADALEKTTDRPQVGIMLPTSGMFPMAAYAGWLLGRAIVPLNYLLKPEDLQHVCDDSGIDAIITVTPMLEFLPEIPRGPKFIRLDKLNFKRLPTWRWPKWNTADELAVLLYTSGTSGRPKGVMLTHGNIAANVDQCREWAEFNQSDSMLGILPQFHVFGMTVLTFLPLANGIRVHYLARFMPRKIVQWITQYRPTIFIAIPTMYNALLTVKNATADDFKSLRLVISGGEPLPDEVARQFSERLGVVLNEGYGLTETSAATHWCRPHEYRAKSVGRALPNVSVRIVGIEGENAGQILGTDENGEIRLAGPNIMKGYYQLPEESAEAFDEEGYFRTGDIGRLDADGYLYLTGRLKEMMIIGGENVFPRDLEEVLNRQPEVYESAVIGVTDPARGEIPIAFVTLHEGCQFNERALRDHCRAGLPQFKVPREIYPLDEMPKNPTGKILRRMLVDPKAAERERGNA